MDKSDENNAVRWKVRQEGLHEYNMVSQVRAKEKRIRKGETYANYRKAYQGGVFIGE